MPGKDPKDQTLRGPERPGASANPQGSEAKPVWSMVCATCGAMQTASKEGLGREQRHEVHRFAAEHLAHSLNHVVHVGYYLSFELLFGAPAGEG